MVKKLIVFVATVCSLALVFFIFFEGLASCILFVKLFRTHAQRPLDERKHTHFDPMLGWSNIPGRQCKDIYRKGANVTINDQGFRALYDYTKEQPPGKIRIICSGDSFTFGCGVDDKETWPYYLDTCDPRIETINMGQGGYGTGQMYLNYCNTGVRFEHRIHIVAFIYFDFERMQFDNFMRYPKPLLKLVDGVPVPVNTPLKKRSFILPYIIDHIRTFKYLRSVELMRSFFDSKYRAPTLAAFSQEKPTSAQDSGNHALAAAIFRRLVTEGKREGRETVFVYLPVKYDCQKTATSQSWRNALQKIANDNNLLYFDLTDTFLAYSKDDIARFFISSSKNVRAAGHYSAEGNRFVAHEIYTRLQENGLL